MIVNGGFPIAKSKCQSERQTTTEMYGNVDFQKNTQACFGRFGFSTRATTPVVG
jgi:hypothetical protein